jgi:pSer/pThr/pTyr-binding forkhead associated (FHA) protein
MQLKINIQDDSGKNHQYQFDKNKIIIGRSSECDIVLKQDGMSRKHLIIEVKDETIYITDLNSANGVLINNEKIPPEQATEYLTFLPLSICANTQIQITID